MGCDGGTIPKRDELVRLKKKPEQKDKDMDLVAKWCLCAISQEPLVQPIVACELGRLYNKESVLEYLLDKSTSENAQHIRNLKDVKVLQLTDNPAYGDGQGADKGDAYIDRQKSRYICPVSGLEMNGRHRFCYLTKCGCVFSERALKEVKSDVCHKCGVAYTPGEEIILNGSEEEVDVLREKMEERRAKAKAEKKAKKAAKHKLAADQASTSSSADKASTSSASQAHSPKDARNGSKSLFMVSDVSCYESQEVNCRSLKQ
ncbi:replication termination factor 2-like isoform X2 [Ptychodera flava]|uniref:replication termination factor 2-like isoform X2 n=1 Tax=Ptychodera flava TaxID=63121 RepID=UPI00396A9A3A